MPVEHRHDVVIVGAGPAGLAAACAAAESGASVVVLDENPSHGGQIWRRSTTGPAAEWHARARRARVEFVFGATVFAAPNPTELIAEVGERSFSYHADKVIIATGARELFLPFPGWTLPNVFGVGGLQALAKGGLRIAGREILIAGTGPLLLAVAEYCQAHGARVVGIAEQTPAIALRRFAAGLWRHPAKLAQGIALRANLIGVPYWAGTWPIAAEGGQAVRRVRLTDGSRTSDIRCDILACAFGLIPNLQLPALLGCQIVDHHGQRVVAVDEHQRTSVLDVYCAGEPTGVGGVSVALAEGLIAGYCAAGNSPAAMPIFARRDSERGFAAKLNAAFALRPELRNLADPSTIVCRCEDVPMSALASCSSWRDAKLQTRCGMGPCQGRICGPALNHALGWTPQDTRPPLQPVRVGTLARSPHAANHPLTNSRSSA